MVSLIIKRIHYTGYRGTPHWQVRGQRTEVSDQRSEDRGQERKAMRIELAKDLEVYKKAYALECANMTTQETMEVTELIRISFSSTFL